MIAHDELAWADPGFTLGYLSHAILFVHNFYHAATADTFPDATVTLDDAVAERDRVATRYTWRASQGPGWNLIAKGGAIVRFEDGQIVECWNLPTEIRAVAD